MQDTIATASRDLLAIKRRKLAYLSVRGPQVALRRGRPVGDADEVTIYPAVDDPTRLTDLLNRLGWYLPEDSVEGVTINVGTEVGIEEAGATTPAGQPSYEFDHLPLEVHDPGRIGATTADADAVLVHDAKARFNPTALRALRRLEFVDPDFYSGVEPATWGRATNRIRTSGTGTSQELFERLERRASDTNRAYVFATGPSLDEAMEMSFEEEAIKVICNSIVRDEALLSHLDPDVLVFADPVFHFGPSKYASQFRSDMADTLRSYDCIAAVPERHRSLLEHHYPGLEFVGVSESNDDDPVFPTKDRIKVTPTNNIMTWFMLPIASSLADEVYVVGADGRKEDDSYFWEHNDDAQYDDELMRSAVDCHPAFFRDRVYTDYYDQHVETLSSYLEYGERRGIEYGSLTHSYVECLADRRVEPSDIGVA